MRPLLFGAGSPLLIVCRGPRYQPNTDFDERVLRSLRDQFLAEAQEVTVERARAKGHKPTLVAAVAHDCKVRFEAAAAHLAHGPALLPLLPHAATYLRFKAAFYAAYALTYTGLAAFADEKAGVALRLYAQAEVRPPRRVPACTRN